MKFTIYDSTGRILRCGDCPEDHAQYQKQEGEFLLLAESHMNDNYVLNGELVDFPPKPNRACTFNYTTHIWEDLRSIADLRLEKWREIKAAREAALVAPLTTPFGIFDGTADAQKSITDAVLMLQTLASLGTPTNIDFTLADNSVVNLTTAQMVRVGLLLGQRTQAVYANGRAKRIAIDSALTAADVDAIVW